VVLIRYFLGIVGVGVIEGDNLSVLVITVGVGEIGEVGALGESSLIVDKDIMPTRLAIMIYRVYFLLSI